MSKEGRVNSFHVCVCGARLASAGGRPHGGTRWPWRTAAPGAEPLLSSSWSSRAELAVDDRWAVRDEGCGSLLLGVRHRLSQMLAGDGQGHRLVLRFSALLQAKGPFVACGSQEKVLARAWGRMSFAFHVLVDSGERFL